MRILPMGPCAVLVDELGADPASWASALRALDPSGVVEIVPAYSEYLYFVVADGTIVIVDPGSYEVVYIISV